MTVESMLSFDETSKEIKQNLPTDDLEMIAIGDQLTIFFINTIIDLDRLHKEIVPCLKQWAENPESPKQLSFILPESVRLDSVPVSIEDLVKGSVIILAKPISEGETPVLYSIQMLAVKSRAIDEPKVEKFILGPKESFIEDFATNIGLLRRRLMDPKLVIHYFQIGERSKTKVAVCFIADIAKPEWVEEIETSLKKINIDAIFEQNDLMELIIEKNMTPFPQYELTESPISVARNLSIGRISIIMEGSPFAASLPSLLLSMLYGSEYIFQGGVIRLAIRMLKMLALFISVYSAALYLSLVSVNTAVLPTQFGLSIAKDQEGIPYAPFFEVIIFVVILDLFIEGTSFVPGMMGPAINVFGSLVIGQAAVESGLASKMIIIITALTVIGTYFSSYQISFAFRLWKYPMIIGAGILGFYGIMLSTVFLLAHVCSIRSLGVPYLTPFAPLQVKDLFRGALWDRDLSKSRVRMSVYDPQDKVKQKGGPDNEG